MTELFTIDQLMEGKKPGEIKIQISPEWTFEFFEPYYKLDSYWYGILTEVDGTKFNDYFEKDVFFKLYKEPRLKKKVILWQWYLDTGILSQHYTEQCAKINEFSLKTGWQKIESTRLEIEVEE